MIFAVGTWHFWLVMSSALGTWHFWLGVMSSALGTSIFWLGVMSSAPRVWELLLQVAAMPLSHYLSFKTFDGPGNRK